MNSPSTTQKDNHAGRNIGGRDVHDQHAERDINIYNAGMPTSLGRLIKRLKDETAGDKSLRGYIEELSLFAQPLPAEPIQGLESKLAAADRSDELYEALALKEMIYERLKANIASPTFQQIYAYLLGLTKDRFATYVRHLIQEGATRSVPERSARRRRSRRRPYDLLPQEKHRRLREGHDRGNRERRKEVEFDFDPKPGRSTRQDALRALESAEYIHLLPLPHDVG